MNELGHRLRQLRISSGMTQSEVGRQVGLSRSAVTQIESGNRDVSAEEVVRFSTIFRHGPEALLSGLGQGGDASVTEMDAMLDDIVRALPHQGFDSDGLRAGLDRLIELSRHLTEIESVLGVTVYGPQASAFRGTSPRTLWEAAHQGYAVAEDERQRPGPGIGTHPRRSGNPCNLEGARLAPRAAGVHFLRVPAHSGDGTARDHQPELELRGGAILDGSWARASAVRARAALARMLQGRPESPSRDSRQCIRGPVFSCLRGEWNAICTRRAGTPWVRASGACWRSSPTGPRCPRTNPGSG